jgi:transcriptional regulator with GAF, ATPase, and Fis domain
MSLDDAAGFVQALAQLALSLQCELSLQREPADAISGLAIITEAAANIIPGADTAAVVVRTRDGLDARAVHGDLPLAIVDLHNEIGQGPCLDAVAQTSQIQVSDTTAEPRWPLFGERAPAIGAGSLSCTPLAAGTVTYGFLILVAKTAGTLNEESARLAAAFAQHAAVALAGTESRQQLSAALTSRDVIGQAKGILMERYRVTADTAFALLSRVSQDTNTKLRDVADELCHSGGLPLAGRAA